MVKWLKIISIVLGVAIVLFVGLVAALNIFDPSVAQKQRPGAAKYAEMAEKIVVSAGTDDVSAVDIMGNRVSMIMRTDGVDARWSLSLDGDGTPSKDDTDVADAYETNSTIKASDVDWEHAEGFINRLDPKCSYPIYRLSVLYFGQHYEQSQCQNSPKRVEISIDGEVIPQSITNDQADEYAAFTRVIGLVFPESKIYSLTKIFTAPDFPGDFTAEGPLVELANGKKVYLELHYTSRTSMEPLIIAASDELTGHEFTKQREPSELMFSANTYPGTSYLNAINEGLEKAPFARERAYSTTYVANGENNVLYSIHGTMLNPETGKMVTVYSEGELRK